MNWSPQSIHGCFVFVSIFLSYKEKSVFFQERVKECFIKKQNNNTQGSDRGGINLALNGYINIKTLVS